MVSCVTCPTCSPVGSGASAPAPHPPPARADSAAGRDLLRHSTAHVLAQAVQDMFPDARLGIGPPITDGFYYDFDVSQPFKPDDLARIETRLRKIIQARQRAS